VAEQRSTTVGFVGVGTIASAVALAMLDGPGGSELQVVLSPRSSTRSREVAARHPNAQVASDNQAVVEASDIVVVGVLPHQVADVCSSLTFRAEQVVVGLAAGWPPSRLAGVVAPAATVCQLIPLPMITLGVGPIVLHPATPQIERLLAGSGTLVVLEREDQIVVLSCASSIMSSYFAFANTTIEWAVSHGLDRMLAAGYVTAQLAGLSAEAASMDPAALPDAVADHETPGGLNEYVRTSLADRGFFDDIAGHLEQIYRTRFPSVADHD
jgi:pyrroline-5-carboxylate reductase